MIKYIKSYLDNSERECGVFIAYSHYPDNSDEKLPDEKLLYELKYSSGCVLLHKANTPLNNVISIPFTIRNDFHYNKIDISSIKENSIFNEFLSEIKSSDHICIARKRFEVNDWLKQFYNAILELAPLKSSNV